MSIYERGVVCSRRRGRAHIYVWECELCLALVDDRARQLGNMAMRGRKRHGSLIVGWSEYDL